MEANVAAGAFWRRAIESYTGTTAEPAHAVVNKIGWHTFRFDSRP
jgi:hypothetical protein